MRNKLTQWITNVSIGGGVLAAIFILLDASEVKNARWFGLSPSRLALAGITLLLFLFFFTLRNRASLRGAVGWFLCCAAGLVLSVGLFCRDDGARVFSLLTDRALPFLIWIFLLGLTFSLRDWADETLPAPLICFGISALVYMGFAALFARDSWTVRLDHHTPMWIAVILTALLWEVLRRIRPTERMDTLMGACFFGILSFAVIRSTSLWMGRVNTPAKAYWHELAEAFLNGRLYLTNPSGTHDLTLYQGDWYVPNPPLPAVLLMPYVAWKGTSEAVNMVIYSALIGAVNGALVYLTLREAGRKGLFPVSLRTAAWVTLCVILGTDHFWLATVGQMWFISQLLTVSFTLLALLLVLWEAPAPCCGFALGLGILCRPNVFTVYLCLMGVYLWQQGNFPRVNLKKWIAWCLQSGIPVLICVFFLLYYNFIRFDDWLDFGYVTINGADWILSSVQRYGVFHPHFIPINFRVMFCELPRLDFSGTRFFFYPRVAGYSVFLMTPALIYLFRNLRKNWWIIGAWASLLLTVGLLLCYHNTGAEQVGFRYLLDAAAPITLLMGNGTKNKIGPVFRVLTVFAVILAFISIYWWYLGRA